MRWAGHVGLMGDGRGVYRVLVGKPRGKRSLGRSRDRWEDNIKDGSSGSVMWEYGLAQNSDRWRALVNAVMNLRVPENARNFLTSCKPESFSRWALLHGVWSISILTDIVVISAVGHITRKNKSLTTRK
jgi:hypothetical protein